MISIDQIAQWFDGWNHLFSHSAAVSGTVTGAHIMALMFGGGFAIAADRATLRAEESDHAARATLLKEVQAVHRPVLIAIVVLFVSGVLLAAADVETFLPSVWFWVKLTLVALLLVNGAVLTLTERRMNEAIARGDTTSNTPPWSRMRFLAWSSVTLWTLTAVAGIVLSNAS